MSLQVASIVKFQQQLFNLSYCINTALQQPVFALYRSAILPVCQVSVSCEVLSVQTFNQ